MPGAEGFVPKSLLFQWHITDRCNLRCRHCYEDDTPERNDQPFDFMLDVLEQYDAFLQKLGIRGHINFSGGEPFLHPRFLALLERAAAHRDRFAFAVLTNGSLIDAPLAKSLTRLGCRFVQVSLEGDETIHDRLRGTGDFRRTIAAIGTLSRAGVKTLVSFTAHRGNAASFRNVVEAASRSGAAYVWTDRLIPIGRGSAMGDLIFSPREFGEFLESAYVIGRRQNRRLFSRTKVRLHRALHHLVLDAHREPCVPYRCSAGKSLITLLADGSVVPCRRMPIRAGSLYDEDFGKIYYNAPIFRALRDPARIPAECDSCARKYECRGGLRCLAYAWHGTPFAADPQCYLIRECLPKFES